MKIVLFNGVKYSSDSFIVLPEINYLEDSYFYGTASNDVLDAYEFFARHSKNFNREDPDTIELLKKFKCFHIANIPDESTDYIIRERRDYSEFEMATFVYDDLYYVVDGKIKKYIKPIEYKRYAHDPEFENFMNGTTDSLVLKFDSGLDKFIKEQSDEN